MNVIRLKGNYIQIALLLVLSLLIQGCGNTLIKIKSTPSGVMVSEAAKGELGLTPIQIKFTADDCVGEICKASFYFSKSGYKDVRVERYIEGDEVLVHAYLTKTVTKLEVKGYPSFAKLHVKYQNAQGKWKKLSLIEDGGAIPSLEDSEPWAGKNYCLIKIIAESPGYVQQEKNIKIAKGEKKVVEYTLEEHVVVGEVQSNPAGADVYERTLGYLGRTPFKFNIAYDQLMRISSQRKQNLNDPIHLYLKFSKQGYQMIEVIKNIGEISDIDTPVQFSVPVNLVPITHK